MIAVDVVEALASACSDVWPGKDTDAVCGVIPAAVAAPGSVAEASALLRAASAHDLAVVPRGAGTKLDWGLPPRRCDVVADTARLDRILEHAAGDLVVRVQAGVPVRRLQAELARAGQQLALDPPDAGGTGGSVGGLIATGMAGPRRLRYGAPRDLLIGITVVLADGTVASSGGKVVKNVAGYDLGKLFAGSRGTLGLIAEATFRLHPVPPDSTYVTLPCRGTALAAEAVRAAMGTQLAPSAVEIDARGRGEPITVAMLLEGRPDAVAERSAKMRETLSGAIATAGAGNGGTAGSAEASAAPPAWWNRSAAGPGGTLLQVAYPPADFRRVLDAIDTAAESAGKIDPVVRGSAGMGVLAIGLDAAPAGLNDADSPAVVEYFVATLRRLIAGQGRGAGPEGSRPGAGSESEHTGLPGASVTVVHAPPEVRDRLDMIGPVPALGLMRAVKDQFDPGHLMAPGRLTGGI